MSNTRKDKSPWNMKRIVCLILAGSMVLGAIAAVILR